MSLDRSAMVEAASQLTKALKLLSQLPSVDGRARQELELQTRLGVALTATHGYAASETGNAYIRARTLCDLLGDTSALVRVGYGEFLFHLLRGDVRQTHQVANEILSLAKNVDSDDARILGHRMLGVSLFESGQLNGARVELETAAKLSYCRPSDRTTTVRPAEKPSSWSQRGWHTC